MFANAKWHAKKVIGRYLLRWSRIRQQKRQLAFLNYTASCCIQAVGRAYIQRKKWLSFRTALIILQAWQTQSAQTDRKTSVFAANVFEKIVSVSFSPSKESDRAYAEWDAHAYHSKKVYAHR
eukprot:gene29500-38603_t